MINKGRKHEIREANKASFFFTFKEIIEIINQKDQKQVCSQIAMYKINSAS